jgi:hypothetical protein
MHGCRSRVAKNNGGGQSIKEARAFCTPENWKYEVCRKQICWFKTMNALKFHHVFPSKNCLKFHECFIRKWIREFAALRYIFQRNARHFLCSKWSSKLQLVGSIIVNVKMIYLTGFAVIYWSLIRVSLVQNIFGLPNCQLMKAIT